MVIICVKLVWQISHCGDCRAVSITLGRLLKLIANRCPITLNLHFYQASHPSTYMHRNINTVRDNARFIIKFEVQTFHPLDKQLCMPHKNQLMYPSYHGAVSAVRFMQHRYEILESGWTSSSPCMTNISRTASVCLFHQRRLHQHYGVVCHSTMHRLVSVLVLSQLDYCNAVLAGLSSTIIDPLRWVLNAAVSLVIGLVSWDHQSINQSVHL